MKLSAVAKFAAGAAVLIGLAASAVTYTNRIGQVVTVDSNGVVTSVTQPSGASSEFRTLAPPLGAQISTNVQVVATQYQPRDIGDLLIGTYSGRVYVATTYSTNGWTQVK